LFQRVELAGDLFFGKQQGGSFDGRLDLDPSEDRHDRTSPEAGLMPHIRCRSEVGRHFARKSWGCASPSADDDEKTPWRCHRDGRMANPIRIAWSHAGDEGAAVGSPDETRWESLSFPRPWPDRPWVFGVMVASANGVVAWRRRGPGDDPVLAILGRGDRPERIADRRLMRYLRTIGDAGVGAQTLREQPRLVLTPQEPGEAPAQGRARDLAAFRAARGLSYHPRNVVYSLSARVPLEHPTFNAAGLEAVIVTTPAGAAVVRGHQPAARTVPLIAEPLLERGG